MVKFPVIRRGMSNNNFLLFGNRLYACYNKFTSPDLSKKLGFLTENTFFFVIQGTKVFYFKDHEIKVDARRGVLLKKGIYAMSEFVTENQCFEALMIFVPDQFLRQFRNIEFRSVTSGQDAQPYATIVPNDLLQSFRVQYLSYFGKATDGLEEILQLKLKELFLLLTASTNKTAVSSFIENLVTAGPADIDYILKSYLLQPLTLAEIADLSGRSLASFKRDFHEIYNMPPKQWINKQRLDHSYRELHNSKKQIAEVAYECGFESTSHFIKIFKKQFGATPNKLRAETVII
ncbi:MAG: transcriptional regulator, AraC family [Mucilaginibacter sp.]|jgi:AraC-like DNA-binding protein|nr:transcriptional regulator, AraC family [Mucilaginibacter sp.]